MTIEEIKSKEARIHEQYEASGDSDAYKKALSTLFTKLEAHSTKSQVTIDRLIDNKVSIDKLSKKSDVSIERINVYIKNPDMLELLDAYKLSIGLKRCGIDASETTLLGCERYEELFNSCMNRIIKKRATNKDYEYFELLSNMPLGINLTQKRIAKGLTRRRLADITGIDVRSIEKYESGEKKIRKAACDTIYALAKGLDCTMEELIIREKL